MAAKNFSFVLVEWSMSTVRGIMTMDTKLFVGKMRRYRYQLRSPLRQSHVLPLSSHISSAFEKPASRSERALNP